MYIPAWTKGLFEATQSNTFTRKLTQDRHKIILNRRTPELGGATNRKLHSTRDLARFSACLAESSAS